MVSRSALLILMLIPPAVGGWRLAATVQPACVFESAFDDAGAIESIRPIARAENFSIASDPEDPANRALKIGVRRGDYYGGSFDIRLEEHMGREPIRVYFRYRLWLDRSWAPRHSGKLPGFKGTYELAGWGGQPSDGTNGWSARGMFGPLDEQQRTPIGSYIYHADMVEDAQTYGNSEWWDARLERERWYTIEQEIQLDSVGEQGGRGDGWLRAWVDGALVFDRRGLHVRDTDRLKIESVWANFYYGGKTPAPTPMSLLIDDLWVGASRPGEAASARQDR